MEQIDQNLGESRGKSRKNWLNILQHLVLHENEKKVLAQNEPHRT